MLRSPFDSRNSFRVRLYSFLLLSYILMQFGFGFALFAQPAPGTVPVAPAAPPAKPPAPALPAASPQTAPPRPAPALPNQPRPAPAPVNPAPAPAGPTASPTGSSAQAANDAAPTNTQSNEEETVWTWLVKGGVTMFGLGFITLVITAFALERFFFFVRSRIHTKGFFEELVAALESGGLKAAEGLVAGDDRLIARILRNAFAHQKGGVSRVEKAIESSATVEIGKLERGLNLLSNLGNLAPLLGFFGTVVGMRASFLQFVEQAAPTARDLAGGVEEALITTAAGLLIAIPTYLIYSMFIFAIDNFSIELERCSSEITAHLKD